MRPCVQPADSYADDVPAAPSMFAYLYMRNVGALSAIIVPFSRARLTAQSLRSFQARCALFAQLRCRGIEVGFSADLLVLAGRDARALINARLRVRTAECLPRTAAT